MFVEPHHDSEVMINGIQEECDERTIVIRLFLPVNKDGTNKRTLISLYVIYSRGTILYTVGGVAECEFVAAVNRYVAAAIVVCVADKPYPVVDDRPLGKDDFQRMVVLNIEES